MNKKLWLWFSVLFIILLTALGRSLYWDVKLSREEAAVNQMLRAQQSRFRDVRIYRSKSHYNLLVGEVAGPDDISFLTNELTRLGVQRCIFAVRSDNALKTNGR